MAANPPPNAFERYGTASFTAPATPVVCAKCGHDTFAPAIAALVAAPAATPAMVEQRIGTYAVCSHGYIGKIERYSGGIWYGTGLSGKRWQSSQPRWLAPDAMSPLRDGAAAIAERVAAECEEDATQHKEDAEEARLLAKGGAIEARRIANLIRAALAAAPAATPADEGDEVVMIPREPTEAMMAAGLYHCSHDMQWADLNTAWKAMFDTVTLDGGCTTQAPAAPAATPASDNEESTADYDRSVIAGARKLLRDKAWQPNRLYVCELVSCAERITAATPAIPDARLLEALIKAECYAPPGTPDYSDHYRRNRTRLNSQVANIQAALAASEAAASPVAQIVAWLNSPDPLPNVVWDDGSEAATFARACQYLADAIERGEYAQPQAGGAK